MDYIISTRYYIVHGSNKVFPIRSAASYGCSQLAVCIHTTDHTADMVYTGTGNIRTLIDNIQDTISYDCHMQELAS